MPDLPARPDLSQLRHQAKDLLRTAKNGDEEALDRIAKASESLNLASAQLALARDYGFTSWPKLRVEVERRRLLDNGDLEGLTSLLADDPELAIAPMEHWCDHPLGAPPLSYVAMLRYDTSRMKWRNVTGTAEMTKALIKAGAPVDGKPGDPETPLITAASYGDTEVAKELIEAGADLEARAAPNAGGVPGGTALFHAAVFGMTQVLDVLVNAGARVSSIEEAAAAGDISQWPTSKTPLDRRVKALVMASDHQRLAVIDEIIAVGTPIDATDTEFGGHPLRTAAANGRPDSVRRLLHHGADPKLRDSEQRTPLDLCREGRYTAADPTAYDQVEVTLEPITS